MVDNVEHVLQRWKAIRPFVQIGAICIVLGGLIAAVTQPLELAKGSWLAAYLVLVGGVAQIGLGHGQGVLAHRMPDHRTLVTEIVLFNASNLVVIASSLGSVPVGTTVGGLGLVICLVLFLLNVRETTPDRWGIALHVYRFLALFVMLSVPVGLALSWVRHR